MIFLQKIKNKFGHGGAARDIATLTLGTAIAQALALAATPLLTRLYTPADFGMLAIFLTVVGIVSTLITGRYETSILIPKENTEAANLVLLSVLLAMAGSALLAVISVFLPDALWGFLGLATIRPWLPLAFAVAGSTAFIAISQAWLNRERKYSEMAKLRVLQSAITVGLALSFAFLQSTWHGLLIAQIIACVLAAVMAIWLASSAAGLWEKERLFHTAKIHREAPKYLLPTALLDVITLQIPIILIAAWFNEAMAGQFSMAWRLIILPMTLIGSAVGQVFIQRFSSLKNQPVAAKKLLFKTWLILFSTGFLPLSAVFFAGADLFSFALGNAWHDSGKIAALMAPLALAMLVSSPTSGTYIVLGLQKYNLLFGLAVFLYRPACFFIGKQFDSIHLAIFLWVIMDIFILIIYQALAWISIDKKTGP